MGNLTGKTEKSGTVGAFDKAGNVDTICILLEDVVRPTTEKLYRSGIVTRFIDIKKPKTET